MALKDENEITIPVCYGESIVDGLKIFEESVKVLNEEYYSLVYVLSEGPIHAFTQIRLNEIPLFTGDVNIKSGVVGKSQISSKFKEHVQVELWNGEDAGKRMTMIEQNSNGKWKQSATLNGRAAVCLKIRINDSAEITEPDINLQAKVKGRPVVDIRFQTNTPVYDYTNAQDAGTNPALCLYDYLTNTRYGAKFAANEIDVYSFAQAANWCDANNLYFNGVVDQNEEYKKIIESMLTAFRGRLTRINGIIQCILDIPSVSVEHFELDSTINKLKVEYHSNKKYFNQLEVSYNTLNFDEPAVTVLYPPTNDDPFILKDNKVIKEDLGLPFTNSKVEVDFLASMMVKDNLAQTEIEFETLENGFNVAVNDVFTISLDELKWVNKAFRAVEVSNDLFGDNPLTVKITAREYRQEVFDAPWDGVVIPPQTKDPVPAPTNLVFAFVESKFGITGKLTWDANVKAYESQVMYKLSAEPDTAFKLYTTTKTNEALISDLKSAYYDFYVVNRDLFTRTSDIVYLRNVNCYDATLLPQVSNLKDFSNSLDFVFTWDDMLNNDIKISDPTNPSTIGSGKVKDVFLGYEVKVLVAGVVVSTSLVQENKYTYTFENNQRNGLSRSISFSVAIVSTHGAKSTTKSINALNAQQPVPNGLSVTGGLSGLSIKFDAPQQQDHKGVLIHLSKTKGFTPNSSTLFADLTSTNFLNHILNDKALHYVRVGAYDCFGKDSIVYSPEFEVSIVDVNDMLEDISSDKLSVSLLNTITGKADTSTVNTSIEAAKTELKALSAAAQAQANKGVADALAAKTQADKGVTDALAASNKATTEANRVLGLANTKTNTDITAAKAVAVADLNAAKVILNQAIADSIVDLAPVNAKILAVEKTSVDADTATALRIDGLVTKTDTQAASITSLSNTVTTNKNAIATRVDSVEASALSQAQAAETNAKTFATASVTTEKNARISADSALTTLVNTVKATADKNKADITTVNTALTTKEAALAQSITNVQANVNTVDGKLTTEATTRASADTAITTLVNTVKATADKNKADIVTVNTALVNQNTAFASSLTTMETAVKADATTKADAAKASALVTAAADAANKANAALAAAKTDASTKASTAESNAKVAAATDAAAKAAQALVDAKSYADAKKSEAAAYTDSKYTQAVTLINQKDSAQATALSTMETSVKTDSTNKAKQALNDALAQSGGTNLLNMTTFTSNGNKSGWSSGNVVEISSVTGAGALDGRTHALMLTTRDSYEYSNPIPVTAGETLYWSMWVNTKATVNQMNFGYRKNINGVAQNTWITATSLAPNLGWTWIQGSQVMHSDATSIVPFLQIAATSNYGSPLVQDLVISRSPIKAGALAAKDRLNASDVGADPVGSAVAARQAAQTYSNGKYNEAITLINQKDSAQSTKTSTLEAAVGYSLSEINNQETNWDFKRGNLNWEYGEVVNDPEVGKCLELTGSVWSTNHVFIPVDTARTYRMSVKIKQHVVNGSRYIYAGVRTYDANFQELTGGAGTYRYCAVSGVASKDVWTTYSGNITGTGSTAMSQFRDGTCYIKLMVIGNYSGGSGKCRFADLKFEDITEQLEVNAKITSVENALATKDAVMATRVTNMETSLKADASTKASTAESNAKVAAAQDAANKANAALAAAKTDASTKASTAESNAKVAAAQDAANKAAQAVVDAKAYADTKKTEAATYTDSKYNQAVTLINNANTSTASSISALETSLKADSSSKANSAIEQASSQYNLIPDAGFEKTFVNGMPIGFTASGGKLTTTARYARANTNDWGLDYNGFTGEIRQETPEGTNTSLYYDLYTLPVSVTVGQRLGFSIYTGAHRCITSAFIYFYNAGGSVITNSPLVTNSNQLNGGNVLSSYKRLVSYKDVPAGAVSARAVLRKYNTDQGQTSSYVFYVMPQLSLWGATQTEAPAWSNTAKVDAAIVGADPVGSAAAAQAAAAVDATSKYNQAVTLINQKDAVQTSSRTSMEATLNTTIATAEANAIDAASTVTLITTGANIVAKGSTIVKTLGGSDWAMQAYSKQGVRSGVVASGMITAGNTGAIRFMFGLNTDPTANASYTTIDYSLYPSNSNWGCYESGASKAILSNDAPAVGDTFSVEYDGMNVRYFINGILRRTVAAAADLIFYIDTSFVTTPVTLSNIQIVSMPNIKDAEAISVAKANQAESNAKAYADTKKTESTTYTNSKHTEAVDLINLKDSVSASRITSMETSVNTIKQAGGLAYSLDITVNGDADKYYPVYVKYGNQNVTRRLLIQRSYQETAPTSWANSSTHKGGLLLDISGNWGGWGGQALDWRINDIKQIYSTMYGGASVTGHNMMFVVFLRGGGGLYHVSSDQALDIQIGLSTSDVIRPDANPSYVVRALPAKTAAASAAEINSKLVSNKAYIGLDQVDNKSSATIVAEAAVLTNAKFNEAVTLLNTEKAASASRMTSIESSVTANRAGALVDARNVATDAQNAAATYTNAKFTDAINTINSKDSARASQIATVEASARTLIDTRGNLLQKYMENWKTDKHPYDCGMGLNGARDENRFVLGDDPFGSKSVLWEMNTNSATNSDGDGGIGAGYFACDSKKSYRFSLYVKKSESGGTTYLGCGGATTQNLNGSMNTNPYFWVAALPQNNKWYLMVGVLQADNGTIDSGLSGLYDCETGVKVSNGTDYRIASGATSQYLRAYLYYSTNPAAKQYFWAPRVDLIDGSEPSLTSLMPNIATNAHASVTQTSSALATLNGRVNATWALRLAAGNKISGIGLANDGATSTFSVLADSFKIYANGADNAVFAVEGGKLVVKSAHIGQLDSANIKAGAINASHIAANTITGDKILAGTKISSPIIEGGQFRSIGPNTMKVESETAFGPDNLVEWRGPKLLLANGEPDWANLKKSNAKRWTDVNGDEYYGGSLSAGTLSQNISNVLLTFYTLNSYLNELGPFTSNGKPKNVIVSYNMSASHRNSAAVSSPTQPKLQWQLERSINNSAWVTVSSGTYNGVTEVEYDQESHMWDTSEYCSGSTTFTDNSTTVGSYSYRIKVLGYSRYHATQNVRSQRLTLISTEQ
uniref:hypothetical protein n=1 Tax=Shewanella sp. TaxID=50422 RepID=UPI004047462B